MDLSEVTKFEEKQEEKSHMPALLWLCAELKARNDERFTFRQCFKSWGGLHDTKMRFKMPSSIVPIEDQFVNETIVVYEHQSWEACALTKAAVRTGMLDRFFTGSAAKDLVIQKMVGLGCPKNLAEQVCVHVIYLNDERNLSYETISELLLTEFS